MGFVDASGGTVLAEAVGARLPFVTQTAPRTAEIAEKEFGNPAPPDTGCAGYKMLLGALCVTKKATAPACRLTIRKQLRMY